MPFSLINGGANTVCCISSSKGSRIKRDIIRSYTPSLRTAPARYFTYLRATRRPSAAPTRVLTLSTIHRTIFPVLLVLAVSAVTRRSVVCQTPIRARIDASSA
ncbi:hypothetical protein GQ53DRAFT_809787 [Thozetella sp. PMI_491]|nr:hypothetical protein GQ53DRAFT_809787 [Thozetella sp. PMI_491]